MNLLLISKSEPLGSPLGEAFGKGFGYYPEDYHWMIPGMDFQFVEI